MKLTRRDFVKTSSAIAAAAALSGMGGEPEAACARSPLTVDEVRRAGVQWFSQHGYTQVKPVSLLSGHSFNGGLTYDESLAPTSRAIFVVQPCARVEDASKRQAAGNLPLFEMLGFLPAKDATAQPGTALLFGFLTKSAGLDATRLRITTTELARPLLPEIAKLGIQTSQVRIRPVDAAKRDGAGSGWYAPKGHPTGHAYATLSVEYVLSSGVEIEIAEIATDAASPLAGGGGIGLARVAMAHNDRLVTWQQALPQFKKAVEEAARHDQKPLPSGYYAILGLPQPRKGGA